MYIKGEVKGKMRHTSKIILAVGIALSLLSCGEEGTSEPLEYPEDSSAEICSSSENAPISGSSDSESFSSSEDLVVSSSSDDLVSSSVEIGSSSSLIQISSSSSPNIRYISYGEMTDERDGRVYKTMTIEISSPNWTNVPRQTWMVENLKYAYIQPTAELDSSSWCYDNKAENCAVTGRLYSWAAAIDSETLASDADNPLDCGYDKTCNLPDGVQGICPLGWHLPSTAEWKMLLTAVGGKFKVDVFPLVGMVLRSQTGWNDPCNGAGTDDVVFSVIPAGRAFNGDFYAAGSWANFWSSTEYDCCADQISLSSCDDDDAVYLYPADKSEGFSVRCVKDDEE